MSVPWTTSAVSLVRSVLASQRFLKSPEIWARCTQGERPVLQPLIAFDPDGRIRMRKVANAREGKKPYVPPPVKPLPEHPFQSMNFLKSNILASLEAQGLIHKARIFVPLTTKEDLLNAERAAARKYRRSVLEAKRAHLPIPQIPPPPATVKPDYYWTVGPHPPMLPDGTYPPPAPFDEPMTKEEFDAKAPPEAWERAEELERQFHKARLLEEENIRERQRIRAEKWAELKALEKEHREQDADRAGFLAQERRRIRAIESIRKYAEETGEDVSAWFEELENATLGNEPPPPLPVVRPQHKRRIDGRVRLTPVPPRKNPTKAAPGRK